MRLRTAHLALLPLSLLVAHCSAAPVGTDAQAPTTTDVSVADTAPGDAATDNASTSTDVETTLDAAVDVAPPPDAAPPEDVTPPPDVEPPLDVAPPPDAPPACAAPSQLCDGVCVAVATSSQHCGGCGVVCNGVCDGGACNPMRDLVAGVGFNCAKLLDGAVRCWGSNERGQLGDGTTRTRLRPTPVTLPGPAQELAAGDDFACARMADGRVFCWGDNRFGQLGRGTFDAAPMPTPAAVAGLSTASHLVAGERHVCASIDEGTRGARAIRCWGNSEVGQTGRGTTMHSNAPDDDVHFGAFAGPYVDLVSGGDRTCVRASSGNLCWGRNIEGELGAPLAHNIFSTPVVVPALAAPMVGTGLRLASGSRHLCTINSAFRVMCSGLDEFGLISSGTVDPATGFRQVPSLRPSTAIAAGRAHTCALQNPGTGTTWVACWGDNLGGQVGDGSGERFYSVGTIVTGIPVNVLHLAAGRDHTCAWDNDGAAWCWGLDLTGFIGPGDGPRRPSALRVVW